MMKEVCFQSSSSGICSLFVSDVMQLRKNHASMFQLVPKEHRQLFSAQIYCCPKLYLVLFILSQMRVLLTRGGR